MNNSRKKLLVALAFVTVAVLATVILLRRQPVTDNLQASDFAATNTQFVAELNQTGDGLTFFTGTSLARLDLSDTSGEFLPSESILKDMPFENIDRVRRGSGVTLVRAYFYPEESLLPIEGQISEGWKWFSIDSDSKITLLPFEDHDKVADCVIEGDSVYALVQNNTNSQSLVQFSIGSRDMNTLVSEHPATSFVGISEDALLMRDYEGNVYARTGDSQTISQIAEGVGEALFDRESSKLITGAIPLVEEEQDSAKSEQILTIFDLKNNSQETLSIESSSFFVNRGYLILPDSLSQPTSLELRDLKNGEKKTLNIDQSQTKVNNPLTQIIIINDDLSLVAGVTAQNYLQLFGLPKYIAQLPVYRLPIIEDAREDYIFDFNIASSELAIYAYEDSPNMVEDSLSILEQTCDCDVNQISKKWGLVPSGPGL